MRVSVSLQIMLVSNRGTLFSKEVNGFGICEWVNTHLVAGYGLPGLERS